MTLAATVIPWVRRLVKSPNPQDISDATILDYLNRFWVYNVPYRIQQFEFKTQYSFETTPNVDRYNAPIDLYNSFLAPALCDGLPITMTQSTAQLVNLFPLQVFNQNSGQVGDGSGGPYAWTIAQAPFLRGHTDQLGNLSPSVYITTLDANNDLLEVTDDGNGALTGDGIGTVNYLTGAVSVTFNTPVPAGNIIYTQTQPYQAGRPSCVLYYNQVFTLRTVPDRAYLLTFNAYLTPAAFANTSESMTFQWMADYLAHGTARMILKDLGDQEQLALYEPYFMEQERLVLRRTIRQDSNTRVYTIFQNQAQNQTGYGYNKQF